MTRLKRFLATCQIPMLFHLQTIVPVIARCHDDIHFALSDWRIMCPADLQVFWKTGKKTELVASRLRRCLRRSPEMTRFCGTRLQSLKKKASILPRTWLRGSQGAACTARCARTSAVTQCIKSEAFPSFSTAALTLPLYTFSKSVVKESWQSGSRAPSPPK